MSLPKFFKLKGADSDQVQDNLVRTLNPLFDTPILGGIVLTNISLASGANTINHKLGKKLSGWLIVRQRASASIYDTQDTNQTPELTLKLNSSAAVVVDIYCF